jgi:UDP-N-acetylglucosamine:LPS N-acetylglucosamine transferase
MNTKMRFRICLVGSAGGHMSQLLALAAACEGHEVIYVTTSGVVRQELKKHGRVYVVGECNRQHPCRIIKVFYRCVNIVCRECPDLIISTGAAPGFLLCLAAKIFGAKIVWVDSIANVERLSMSGRMIRHFADLFLTQWPEFAQRYRNVEYAGAVV